MVRGRVYIVICITILTLTIVSCVNDLRKSSMEDDIVIYPPPPGITRIQYLTSISTSSDMGGKQSAINKFLYGEEVPKHLIKPYGVTVSGSILYICDTGLRGMVILDLAGKSFEYFIPGGKGELQLPLNCSVDERGFLYIADGNRQQIVVFNEERKYISEFGEPAENFKPTDVVVNGDRVYVTSIKDQKIYVYDKTRDSLIFKFPDLEPGDDGYLYQPTSLFVNQSYIYVSDLGDNRIKSFSHEGRYIGFTGGHGDYPGQLMRPKGVAVDNDSNLYVVDAAFENVQIFNKEGKVLMSFGGPYFRSGDMYLPADVSISYSGLEYFTEYVDDSFVLKYLIYVTNQYGPDKINVYGFVDQKSKREQ